jgi:integrase
MGLTRYSIYKYVKTAKGWRYCRPAYSANRKIKPNAVLVGGKEEVHPEGSYYLNVDGRWEKVGDSPVQAQEEQRRRLARQRYEKDTGEKLPAPEPKGELLSDAIDAYLAELELKVAGKSRRPKTLAASRLALNEFADQSGVKFLKGVTGTVIATHMARVIENSPTRSARTAANKFLLILQFLKHAGAVPMVGVGRSSRPLGMKDAPRYVETPVETYTEEELARFFFACGPREAAIFQTFYKAGLRENELATLRRQDCELDGPAPCLKVVERPEYKFTPKAYQIRDVSIPPDLAALLRCWLGTHDHDLVFPTPLQRGDLGKPFSRVDGHILRLCKRFAKRAGLDPDGARLHKFRSTYATICLRKGMDLETLRAQLGHRDTESLRRYVVALKDELRARKVAEVFSEGAVKETGAVM